MMRLDVITVFIFYRKYSNHVYASVHGYVSTYVYASVYGYVFTYQIYSKNHQSVNFSLFTTDRIKQGK